MHPTLDRPPCPLWGVRLIQSLPLPPAVVGLGIASGVYGVFLVWTVVFGPSPGELPALAVRPLWIPELILALAIGFCPVVTAYTLRGTTRDLQALRPVLRAPDSEHPELLRRITLLPVGLLRGVGVVSALLGTLWIATDPTIWVGGERPAATDPAMVWLAARNTLHIWLLTRAALAELILAHSFSLLADHLAPIALLDSRQLQPFGRRGLRPVLLWMLLAALHSLLFLGDWAADALAFVLIVIVSFAGAAFLLPVTGARRRIHEAKERELGLLREAIRRERDRVLEQGRPTPGALGDLIAYESRIRGVSDWPFDTPTLLRFVLYVGIGVGSWVGGAVVERVLDLALD